jgi:hypothetical protein
MRRLYSERKSGVLHVSASGLKRRLYFRKGAAIFADSADATEKLTRERAEALLTSIFSWTSGQFSFEERDPEVDETMVFQKPPAELILEGSRSILDPRVLETLLGTRGSMFARSQTTELSLFTVKLAPVESGILKLARERDRFTAADLAQISSEPSVRSALNVLVSLGLLDIVQKAEPPQPLPEPVKKPAPVATPPPPPPPRKDVGVLDKSAQMPPSSEPEPKAAPAPPAVVSAPKVAAAPRTPPRPKRAASSRVEAPVRPTEAPSSAIPEPDSPRTPAPRIAPRGGQARFGKWLWIAAASIAVAGVAGLLALWLHSGKGDEMPELPAVVSAASEPAFESPDLPAPPPETESPAPTEAELLSRATTALEAGDPEAARLELTALLQLRPDHAEAQELMARVERDLASTTTPSPAPDPNPAPRRSRKPAETATEPNPAETSAPPETGSADPARLFDEARVAFARGDLDASEARLEEILSLDPNFPGAWKLREDLADKRWERTLPHKYGARHAHRLGGCVGVVMLTPTGISYRSNEHQWEWTFPELARAIRKDERHLSLETKDGKSFNFELGETLSALEWTRFLELAK